MTTLTKSLHTVTAAVNVAAYVVRQREDIGTLLEGAMLARRALAVLGYVFGADYTAEDPTYVRIVAQCKALAEG